MPDVTRALLGLRSGLHNNTYHTSCRYRTPVAKRDIDGTRINPYMHDERASGRCSLAAEPSDALLNRL